MQLRRFLTSLAVSVTLFSPLAVLAANIPGLAEADRNLTSIGGRFAEVKPRSLEQIIQNIVNFLLGVLGIIFLLLVVYAGYLYLTALGDKDNVKKALTLLKQGLIGLALVVASWAISTALIDVLVGITTPPTA